MEYDGTVVWTTISKTNAMSEPKAWSPFGFTAATNSRQRGTELVTSLLAGINHRAHHWFSLACLQWLIDRFKWVMWYWF